MAGASVPARVSPVYILLHLETVLRSCVTILIASLIVLHPRYKLQYFKDAGWPRTWIQNARLMLLHEYDLRYKSQTTVAEDPEDTVSDAIPEVKVTHFS